MIGQTAEQVAVLAAGLVTPFVTAVFRRYLSINGAAALGLTLLVSGGLALAAMGVTHTLGADWWQNALQALAIATVIYRGFEMQFKAIGGK